MSKLSVVPTVLSVTLLLAAGLACFPPMSALAAPVAEVQADTTPTPLTSRQLTAPGALAGPSPTTFAWSPNGALLVYVTSREGQDALVLYDAAKGTKSTLLDAANTPAGIELSSVQWSPQGDSLLFGGAESLWVARLDAGTLQPFATSTSPKTAWMFLPDGAHVSYVQENDIYVVPITGGEPLRLTNDGGEAIFNGSLDWVYNEELATRAAQPGYAWSPDGRWLLYLRLDDRAVQNDPVTDYRPVPPTVSYTRYPTVGTANPLASLHLLAPDGSQSPLTVELPAGAEYVLPYFTWAPDSREVFYMTVNRDHTVLELSAWNLAAATRRTVLQETDPYWINEERYAAPLFLGRTTNGGAASDGQPAQELSSLFLWISERSGFMHLYLYSQTGELVRQLTEGDWMIDSSGYYMLTPGRPAAADPSGTWAYFASTRKSPLERQIDRVNIATGDLETVSHGAGFHLPSLSGDGRYLVDSFSNVATPPVTRILDTNSGSARLLAMAAPPALDLPDVSREFVTLKAHDGTDLYAQLVKPAGFDPNRKYPVVVHWYGGTGLQMVSNRYGTTNIFNIIERDVLYTQSGFLVWRLDNRGSFGRGHAFETPIFGELGAAALDDQLAGIEYLRTLPYVDGTRIGTDGKSFGGYMTLYALINAPDTFRCGVAGAAPTDWSYYDTIYTERYMRTPAANPDGYAATNLVAKASQIQARPLLIHGLADTNVHLQNTVNFVEALEAADKQFEFVPLPNLGHSFRGNGLIAALSASAGYLADCLDAP